MCGIVGFFDSNDCRTPSVKAKLINDMAKEVAHRGPDEYGFFSNESRDLYLAHQRLAIHDLTEAGAQPMHSHCGGYVIVFNGEIYNYKELKKELDLNCIGKSDTEVLLECLARHGVSNTLRKLNGMFAFALYNKKENKLTLARDRFGEKPLYIYSNNRSFAFSSELRPIEIFQPNLTLNQDAVATQLKYSYIPSPISIYDEVFKLPAAHYLEIDLNLNLNVNPSEAFCYWDLISEVEAVKKNVSRNLDDSVARVETALRKSVRLRMDSDVPFGSFLSGGIDSTCIVALMQSESSKKIDTFSIGFNSEDYNEAHHAKKIANLLGTNHHELYLEPKDMLDYIPKLSSVYDEPFSDSSQLPTLMVSLFAKDSVTVALTGDSGDELFAGYNRHLLANKLEKYYGKYPLLLRESCSKLLKSIDSVTYDKVGFFLRCIFGNKLNVNRLGDNVHKFARAFEAKNGFDLYQTLISTSLNSELVLKNGQDFNYISKSLFDNCYFNLSEKMMLQDTLSYMQHDILTKVDRASMAASLETRVPFLDNDVFSTAWSIPFEHKIHNGRTKYPLRKIISNYIPDEIMNRPKAGFGVPIVDWLRFELRDWAESLLSKESLALNDSLCEKSIRKLWGDHQAGKSNNQYELWNILMLQQWLVDKNRKQLS